MADDPNTAKPEPSPAVLPVVAPSSAPVAGETASQAAVPAPPAAAAEPLSSTALPANELAKPAEAAKEPGPHDVPTELETIGEKPAEPVKTEAKPGDPKAADKPAGDAKPPDAAPAEAKPAEPPAKVEYKYTLPETVALDDTLKGELHTALDEFRANPAEGAQKLIDMHVKTLDQFADNLRKQQRDIFAETNKAWHKEILADPQLGGSGYQTTSATVARMRDLLVSRQDLAPRQNPDGTPRMSAFQEMCRVTGVGNHPVFWRMLHNAAKYADEPQANHIPTELKPPPDIGRNPNRRRGAEILYDNPRSAPNGRG